MKQSAYNYSLAEEYKQKIAIPYTSLEFNGWLPVIACVIFIGTITFVLGTLFSYMIGSLAYYLFFAASILISFVAVFHIQERNDEIGRTNLDKFFYQHIKKKRAIYDAHGRFHLISKKRKGVMYHVCR